MKRTAVDAISIRAYEDSDEPEVLELLRTSMGEGPSGERSPGYFRWKHVDNPFGRSFILIAEADGRPVGLRAFMRWCFVVDGMSIPAVRAVDTATHPSYQRMGIFSRLTLGALESLRQEAAVIFNTPNKKSLPGYLKMGWDTVGTIPVYVRVVRPVGFARGLRSIALAGAPSNVPGHRVEAPRVESILTDPALPSLLGRMASVPHRFSTPRTVDYLRWRYGRGSGIDYRALVDRSGNDLSGIAIFRVRARGSLREATIVELLTGEGESAAEQRLMKAVRKACVADHVTYRPLTGRPPARLGFLPVPGGPTLVVNELGMNLHRNPRLPASWALSVGDLEVL